MNNTDMIGQEKVQEESTHQENKQEEKFQQGILYVEKTQEETIQEEKTQQENVLIEKIRQEKLTASVKEQLLVPLALAIAILFDRLIVNLVFDTYFLIGVSVFWLCYIVGFYVFYWKRVKDDKLLWYSAICSGLLCIWAFLFTSGQRIPGGFTNWEYSVLSFFVIPGVLMAHAQLAAGKYDLKRTGHIAVTWIVGWIITPFSGIPAMVKAVSSLISGDVKKDTARKSVFGILLALLLLCVIVPLLNRADKVFGYYTQQLFANFSITSLFWHTFVVVVIFMLFYSFLWNVGFGKKEEIPAAGNFSIDKIIAGIVLGTVNMVYIIFCFVQFTYLFAGAGLPDGMTYSAYAREGFGQTVFVCTLNLIIFGVFLEFSEARIVKWLLGVLLGLTAIKLFSGLVRLNLYIDAYGFTWLRLLSAWFIVYLAVVIILCAVRMYFTKIPLIAICAMVLLGWYICLGYANPDWLVGWYNTCLGYDLPWKIY